MKKKKLLINYTCEWLLLQKTCYFTNSTENKSTRLIASKEDKTSDSSITKNCLVIQKS